MCTRLFSLLFALLFVAPVLAAPVSQFTLPNGLKLFVKPNHRAPVVVSQIWYKVGASYEPTGISGVSHALEHMMFKGTKQFPAGKFSQIIAENGGVDNAATSSDYTFYYQELAADRLAISFELEADRMANLNLLESEFAKEIQVVMEERRMRTDDDPQGLAIERLNAAAFLSSPYHHPIIGWMQDLTAMQLSDLRKWYQTWYAPNNAVIVVVGDVSPQAVYQLALRYFGKLKPSSQPSLPPQGQQAHLGSQSITIHAPAKVPWLLVGYHVPSLATEKNKSLVYALEVIAGILDGGESARLESELVRGQEVASSIGVNYTLYSRLNDLFVIYATPAHEKTVSQLQAAISKQIKQLQEKPVTAEELERVKAQVVASKIYAEDSLTYQARLIGSLESTGLSYQVADQYVDEIEKITAADIQAAAKQFLIPNREVVTTLLPAKLASNKGDSVNVAASAETTPTH